jgi:glutathione S-transferase
MIRVYGSRISYYAGKLEAFLRYRSIDYELLSMVDHAREIREGAGAVQSPVVQLEDGRWMSDSTPILAWLDARQEGPSIYPADPAMRFIALLLEDHADEWLWRPAMHYRWSFLQDRQHASGVLADELLTGLRRPRFAKRLGIIRRQFGGFVRRDGVSAATRGHVERTAMAAFDGLEAILAERPFLLGDRPTIADFGFVGPMLRHFGQDPTPAELMRQRAPRLYVWVARMWEARWQDAADLVPAVDPPLSALLREVCETHLVQLRENARAHERGRRQFDQEIQGCRYEGLPVSRYRVWCLEELRRLWRELDGAAQATVRAHLTAAHAAVLWEHEPVAKSDYDPERLAPFNRAINVFDTGVPS